MAIIIEEERNKMSPITLLTWGVVLVIIVVTVYYVFFKKPQTVEIIAPPDFQNTQQISKINLDPEVIIEHPGFKSRTTYVTPPVPGNLGRSNPFLPF